MKIQQVTISFKVMWHTTAKQIWIKSLVLCTRPSYPSILMPKNSEKQKWKSSIAGDRSCQLTSAGRSANHGQIGWHWLAGNFYFPRRRIFIFCFLNPWASILKDMRVWCIVPDFLFKSVWPWCGMNIWLTRRKVANFQTVSIQFGSRIPKNFPTWDCIKKWLYSTNYNKKTFLFDDSCDLWVKNVQNLVSSDNLL